MKKLITVLAAALLLFAIHAMFSNTNLHYSPLDTYINASIKSSADNYKSAADAKRFIDSLNNTDIKAAHVCSDTTHKNCDGGCICDGMECK